MQVLDTLTRTETTMQPTQIAPDMLIQQSDSGTSDVLAPTVPLTDEQARADFAQMQHTGEQPSIRDIAKSWGQKALAIYVNVWGSLVIKEESDDDDTYVCISADALPLVIAKMTALLPDVRQAAAERLQPPVAE